jgi:hypothetical protein
MIHPSHDPELAETWTVIHHVTRERDDLLPSCGQLPGSESVYSGDGRRSATTEFWHTIHTSARAVLAHAAVGHGCCSVCLNVAKQQRAASG